MYSVEKLSHRLVQCLSNDSRRAISEMNTGKTVVVLTFFSVSFGQLYTIHIILTQPF